MKKILVSGATGFLGSAFVERLLKEGYEVIGLGRKNKGFLSKSTLENSHFSLLLLDLTKKEDFEKIESLNKLHIIFHLASLQPSSENNSYNEFHATNVYATYKMLQVAKKLKIKKFIHISTISIFSKSPKDSLITEKTCPEPTNYYGLTKYMGERLVEIELLKSDVKGVVVRFPSIYGKNHLGGIVHTFYSLAKQKLPIEVYSKGERYRNLLYVGDAVEILIRLLKYDLAEKFEIFGTGSSDSQTMFSVATLIRNLMASKSEIILVDKFPPNDFDVFVNISKLKNAIKFTPHNIKNGIKKYLKDLDYEV